MDPRLERALSFVAIYLRRIRFMWLLSGAWIALAVLALWMYLGGDRPLGGSQISLWILFGLAVVAVVGTWSLSQRAYRNSRKLAKQIEAKFPALRQRLITSIQQPVQRGRRAGYLQESLIDETLAHAALNNWRETMPRSRIALAWAGQVLSLAAFLAIFSLMLFSDTNGHGTSLADSGSTESKALRLKVSVEPGNAEVEKGSNLVVTARFVGGIPAAVWLASQSAGSEELKRQEMRRNLQDPVFGGFLVNIANESRYRVEFPDGQSEEYLVKVFEYPMLLRSDALVQPPAYTKQEAKRVEDTRRVSVMEGSTLTWICNVNKVMTEARLVDEQGNVTELRSSPDNPLAYSAEMVMKESKRWKLQLKDDAGRTSKIEEDLVARVLPNKPPEIKLARASDASVSPIEELVVGATITEDFGLHRFGISYNFASSPPVEIDLTKPVEGNKKLATEYLIDFESLKAEPDQLLSYHFWAEDYDRDGNIRHVNSDMFFAEVRPFEEIFREGQSPPGGGGQQQQQQQQQGNQNAQQAEQLAELQKQIITGTWNVIRRESYRTPSDKFAEDVTVLIESQSSAIEQLASTAERLTDQLSQQTAEKVARDMGQAVEQLTKAAEEKSTDLLTAALGSEQAAYQGLLRLRAREHEVVRQQRQQRQQRGQQQGGRQQQRQQQLDQLRLRNEDSRYEQEQTATPPEEQQQREVRQVANRLAELARRQQDINRQLQELQSALEAAQTEQQRQDIEEQLKRLRDTQEELLRDSDELLDRLNQEQNREQLADARQQTEQARENIRESAQALSENQASQALSAGTRAERQLSETENELREQAANAFSQSMRDMVRDARQLDETQQRLNQQMQGNSPQNPRNDEPGLRSETPNVEIDQELIAQQQKLKELLEQMQKTVSEAEVNEPLLADQLYDSFRETKQANVEQRLELASQLMQRGLEEPARTQSKEAGEGISRLRENVEQAAENILGNDTDRLRRANNDLQRAIRDLEDEMRRRGGSSLDQDQQDRDPNSQRNQNGQGSDREGQDGQQQQGADSQSGQRGEQQQGDEGQEGQQGQRGQRGRNGQQDPNGQRGRNGQRGQEGQQGQEGQRGRNGQEGQRGQPGQEGQQGQQPGQEGQQGEQGEQGRQGQSGRNNQSEQVLSAGFGRGQPGQQDARNGRQGGARNDARQGRGEGGVRRDGNPALANQWNGGGLLDRVAEEYRGVSPITGDDFVDWTDVLRDVEEVVNDPELSSEAARIREAAREFRQEFRRHGKEPQWPLVQRLVAEPLKELRLRVEEELLRRSAEKNAIVPIDRDPVPPGFEEALRRYYENLGSGR